MERCKTCKHWTLTHTNSIPEWGRCSQLKHADGVEFNIRAGWEGGYLDTVDTTENFGCVEHEAKS